jgi:outer membrane protein insertion porin family
MTLRPPLAAAGLVLWLLASGSVASASISDYLGKPVGSVRLVVEGRETTDPALVQLVETQIGEPLSMTAVRESITHLYSIGRFEDVRAVGELERGRVALVYELQPIHPVYRIDFTGTAGVPGIDAGALRQAIVDRYGVSPPVARVADIVQLLTDALRQRGYLHPTVTPRVSLEHAPDRARLLFTIQPGPRTRIASVDITGNPMMSRRDLLDELDAAPGAPYQPLTLDTRIGRYIEGMRRRGYFEAQLTPGVQLTGNDRAAHLTLAAAPGPHVRIAFTGDPLPSNVRNELVPVESEGSVDEDLLDDSSNRIEEHLRAQGYRDASAPHRSEESAGELLITFNVTKGPQYRVEAVEISGNASLPLADFAPDLRVRAGQPFSDAQLNSDVSMIEGRYRREGFAGARVQTVVEPQGGRGDGAGTPAQVPVVVRLVVHEGPQTIVRSVHVSGNWSVPEVALLEGLGLRPGRPFFATEMAVDRDTVQLRYADLGYPDASVDANPGLSRDATRADVVFTVREGPRVYVNHVLIVGNVRTKTETIQRELEVKPGEPLSLAAVNESQRRLAALGLFRRVRISELRRGDETRRDVLVTIEEAPATMIGYGGGFEVWRQVVQQPETLVASEELQLAPRASFEISRRNLFGKNRSVNAFTSISLQRNPSAAPSAAIGVPEYRILGTYREPRLFGTAADAVVTGTVEQQIRTSFKFARRRASAEVARHLTRSVSMIGSYQIERTRVFDELAQEEPYIRRLFSQVRLSSFSVSAIRDTRNDQMDPGRGRYFSASGQLAGRAIGSEIGLAKGFLTAQTFRTIPGASRIVFAGSARFGLAAGFPHEIVRLDSNGQLIVDVVRDLPPSERFFAGGDTTNRGFALDTLGTPDTIDVNGFPLGGNGLVILNAELRVPLLGGIGVVTFLDTGNVFARASDINLGELRTAVGFGVRYKSPVGPIRIDLGFKLHREQLASGGREALTAIHISLGQAF